MMLTALLLAAAALGVLASSFVSAVETGSYVLNRVRLRVLSEQGNARARALAHVMQRPEDLVVALLLANTLVDFLTSNCVLHLLRRGDASAHRAELFTTLIMTPIILVFGGVIPKDLFQREADRWMYPLAQPIRGAVLLGRWVGIVPLMRVLTRALTRWIDPAQAQSDETGVPRMHVRRLLHEGAARGGLTVFQRDTLDRVLNIAQVRVADVMVPRARAAIISLDIGRADFLRVARMAHFSRMPAHQPGDPRRIVGIINVHDVIADLETRPIREYAQPALCVQDGETVPAAMLKLQNSRQVMGVAVDGAGNCVGLFTMKDLVEEIVGGLEVW
ncbi:MAG: DUF21 domain-containing protein [Planctomycetes bacterium]|nr:DUF21 domain-containing protein [Planctomycetota bacterium]